MPSPFPGMDPYLESPRLWPDVHHELISELRAELNRQLQPRYFARLEDRVYLSDEDDPGREYVIPDVHIIGQQQTTIRPIASVGGVALIEPIEISPLIEDEIHEIHIDVVDAEHHSIVAVIEVLSPTKKIAGSYGRKSYQQKRTEIIRSQSHLIEIDLLRAGVRMSIREKLPPHEYLVHVSRVRQENDRTSMVWPIPLPLPLPIIPIPLKDGDSDAQINLQEILAAAYQRGAYHLAVNYDRDPIPPLSPDLADWSKQLLKQRA